MDTILRVNMTDLSFKRETAPADWHSLGGRGLTSIIVASEVPPRCHPLGPNNKLVFAPGLLSGTMAAQSGRLSAGAKSPLTGTIKESNAGGTAAQQLAKLGIKALIIEGKAQPDHWYHLHVSRDEVTFESADDLAGQGNRAVVAAMLEKYNDKVGVVSIGPAGEMRMASAEITVKDPTQHLRSIGRGGLGAVMGAKQVKCITIEDPGADKVAIADEEKFREAAKLFAKTLLDHPVSGEGLPTYGTNILINILNEAGGLPTKNFRSGQCDHHDQISGETMRDIMIERKGRPKHGCHVGCVIQCSQIYNDPEKNFLTAGFEYETIWGLGANCLIKDLDDIAECDRIMDDIGIDSIEAAVVLGVAMEAGVIPWGDGKECRRVLRDEIGKGTALGRILGNGAGMVGRAFGQVRVPIVKNQGIPAYDPRTVKGIGVTYATSTMGADHTAGYSVATNILKVGGFVDPLSKVGQVELSRNLQIATAAIDATGMCIFIAFPMLDVPETFTSLIDMINAQYDLKLADSDFMDMGKRILKAEHAFNLAAGFGKAQDRLPEFFSYEPLPPHNTVWDFSGEELDAFWDF